MNEFAFWVNITLDTFWTPISYISAVKGNFRISPVWWFKQHDRLPNDHLLLLFDGQVTSIFPNQVLA